MQQNLGNLQLCVCVCVRARVSEQEGGVAGHTSGVFGVQFPESMPRIPEVSPGETLWCGLLWVK